MTFRFDIRDSLVRVRVELVGLWGRRIVTMALDTGASRTVVTEPIVRSLGIDTSILPRPHSVTGATGNTTAGDVRLDRLSALGAVWPAPTVMFYHLNPRARIDGLLGLDFLRGRILTLDFARGRIALSPPRPWWAFWR